MICYEMISPVVRERQLVRGLGHEPGLRERGEGQREADGQARHDASVGHLDLLGFEHGQLSVGGDRVGSLCAT
jgi:hypothetical protein